ncbi:Synaptic vesicle membrane protein VAT-1-like [Stylophora pistillata]|uniref:Synaptic vesicle membrane protein VAT-1-like n=1 Tax=Stylophora pistillata TaxID=50429 RepID=A0A2B4SSC5_STYPI|nr:Synaptic vesicle membrane protein VAT-1-like [Stylophora pistillata]
MAESTEQAEQSPPPEDLVEEKGEDKSEHLELQPEQETMRCVVLTGYGGYNKLEVQKYAKPKPMNGQVVIRVHARQVYIVFIFYRRFHLLLWITTFKYHGLNFADIIQRQGIYPSPKKPPFIPGMECAGIVEELGEGATELEVGSRVVCLTGQGAWSEYACVPAKSCFVIPDSMSFEDAAAIPITYLTAYFMLFLCASLGQRKSVLIHMAAGGVGIAAAQLCKTVEGVTTFGTASAFKHETILANGIDHAIDYRTVDYVQEVKKICPEGVDIVLDSLGGADTKKGYNLLRPMGIIVCFGNASAVTETKSVFTSAKNWFQGATFNPLQLLRDSKTVGKAMQRMHQRKNVGKIIISPMKEPTLEPTPQPPAEPAPTEEEDGKTEDKEGEEKTEDKEGEEKTGGEKEEPKAEEEKKEEAAA